MRVIPVLDLMHGTVVHAVRGQRALYQPLETAFGIEPTPKAVASLCVNKFLLRQLYVADLDAIQDGVIDWRSLTQLAAMGATLLLDAGTALPQQAEQLAEWHLRHGCLDGVIVGLESTKDAGQWPELVRILTAERAIFSLDLRAGIPLAGNSSLAKLSALEIARCAYKAGFRRLIVLDLAAVGTGDGPVTLDVCRAVRAQHAWAELISGGAVRNAEDLAALQEVGCDAALVASALYRPANGTTWTELCGPV